MADTEDIRDMTPLDLIRALRMAGRAAEACALATRLADSPDPGCWLAQLGIDLNFLGMHAKAERFLKIGLAEPLSMTNRYSLTEELCTVLMSLGKFHEAHEHFRTIRGRSYAEAFHHLILVDSSVTQGVLQDKLLGMDEPVAGLRIYVLAEGGFGDFVQFSRYIDALLREGASAVVLEYFPGWDEIFQQSEQVELSLATNEQRFARIQSSDRITFPFSLFARYQRSPYFPMENPGARIAIDPAKRMSADIDALLNIETARPKVGLIWRSASKVRQEPYRSMPLARLEPLLAGQTCQFYSLQVGDIGDDERAMMDRHGVIDIGPRLATFGDTARVLEQLDLLVTVDTGAAHLAGALNRPVWVMLSQACDSRWLDCQRFTPWYPSMWLYRQTELGNWTQPLADLQRDLNAFAMQAASGNP
ncbi:tetratricopeptide repeat protein [Caballeronia fortuita]|uniref:Tetratricopeptide repeat protein n=1 Tax=Caballeronia fortuita TaxID=1777138 RepID=A0A158D9A2_9BURK|nr:glycosyltransferase family 9 protein [Caballeronia fortuita]SAK91148.1 tetratricopeptide repeat protein [Caballeronia fortuita]